MPDNNQDTNYSLRIINEFGLNTAFNPVISDSGDMCLDSNEPGPIDGNRALTEPESNLLKNSPFGGFQGEGEGLLASFIDEDDDSEDGVSAISTSRGYLIAMNTVQTESGIDIPSPSEGATLSELKRFVQANQQVEQAEARIRFDQIAASFGSNLDLPQGPDGRVGPFSRRRAFTDAQVLSNFEAAAAIGQAQQIRLNDFKFYAESEDPTEFFADQWGEDSMRDFSNSRYGIYHRLREAILTMNNKKYIHRRAFPTYKLYFINESDPESEWTLIDDVYTYSQIESIRITDSRKRPASVAMISFIDLEGVLDGNNEYNAALYEENPSYNQNISGPNNINQGANNTSFSRMKNGFVLDQGVRIKIKLGYSNNHNSLTDVFLGEVTELEYSEEGTKVTVIAQSYGTELIAEPKGTTKKEFKKEYNTTFELLSSMMFEPEVVHFGRHKLDSTYMIGETQSLRQNQLIYRRVSRNPLSLIKNTWNWFGSIDVFGIRESARQINIQPREGPQDDNIYAPNWRRAELRFWFTQLRRIRRVSIDGGDHLVSGQPELVDEGDSVNWLQTGAEVAGRALIGTTIGTVVLGPTGGIAGAIGANLFRNRNQPSEGGSTLLIERIKKADTIFNIFWSTIWDLFQEMTLRHPGYVTHPRIYENSNRMTMFFGLPDQRYWFRHPTAWEVSDANNAFNEMIESAEVGSGERIQNRFGQGTRELTRGFNRNAIARDFEDVSFTVSSFKRWYSRIEKRRKPFRDWHHITSYTDIIRNNIIANKYNFFTGVKLQYATGRRIRRALNATSSSDDSVMNPAGMVNYKDKHVIDMKAHNMLSPENTRYINAQYPNCRGPVIGRRYARGLLGQMAREMYKGSLVLFGNPLIKPYDVLMLNDTYNDIHGPVSVEEVIHTFTPQTGFITEVIPDTFIIHEDTGALAMMEGLRVVSVLKTDIYRENTLFLDGDTRLEQAYRAIFDEQRTQEVRNRERTENGLRIFEGAAVGLGLATGISATGTAVSASLIAAKIGGKVGAFGGPKGAIAGALVGASLGYLAYTIGMTWIINRLSNHKAFIMIPLIRKGDPWLAGFEMNPEETFIKSTFGAIERWIDDGNQGMILRHQDARNRRQRVRNYFGDELTRWNQFKLNVRDVGGTAQQSFNIRAIGAFRDFNNFTGNLLGVNNE